MKKVIIYVDDDIDDIEVLEERFASHPEYSFQGLNQGILLLNLLDTTKNVCLVVLDINMPIINGVELLKQLKAHPLYSKLPVVMLSTSKLHSEQSVINELGVDIVLKPTSYRELRHIADRLIEYCK